MPRRAKPTARATAYSVDLLSTINEASNERARKRRAQRQNGGEPDFIRMVKAIDIPPTKPRRRVVAYSAKIVRKKGQDCQFKSQVLIQLEGTLETQNLWV